MKAMLVVLWTHEPYGFPLYNASKHSDRSPSELEMNMERAARNVAAGAEIWIPCTVGHTNSFNDFLRKELLRRRDEGIAAVESNAAIDVAVGGRERAAAAAKEALQKEANRVREIKSEVERGIGGLEAPTGKKAKPKTDAEALARMRDQLGLFD